MNKIIAIIVCLLLSFRLYASNCLECAFTATAAQLKNQYRDSKDAALNGKIPPEKIGGSVVMLLERQLNGVLYRTERVYRNPGFRSVVHYHLFAVTTCMLQGTTTFELQGHKNHEYRQGQCFTMPPFVKGSNVNRGKIPVVLIDYLASAPNTPFSVPLEKHAK